MAPRPKEKAKKVAAILGALLRDAEGVQAVAAPEEGEAVAALAVVLRLLRRKAL